MNAECQENHSSRTLRDFITGGDIESPKDLVDSLLSLNKTALIKLLECSNNLEVTTANTPSAIMDDMTLKMLRIACKMKETSFEMLGKSTKGAVNPTANSKYGELRGKLLIGAGVLTYESGHVMPTDLGNYISTFSDDNALKTLRYLCLRIPIIQNLLRMSIKGVVYAPNCFVGFEKSTIIRRLSSIKNIVHELCVDFKMLSYYWNIEFQYDENISDKYLLEEKEYNSKASINDEFSTARVNGFTDYKTMNRPILTNAGLKKEEIVSEPCESRRDGSSDIYLQIKFIVSDIYAVSKNELNLDLECVIETLQNILEDPESELISDTLCNIALGYFTKYCNRGTLDSIRKAYYVAVLAINEIYDRNQDLLLFNLSESLDLSAYYTLKDNLNDSITLDLRVQASDESSIVLFIENYSKIFQDDAKYRIELKTLYYNLAILTHKFGSKQVLNYNSDVDNVVIACISLINGHKFNLKSGGVDKNYCPLFADNMNRQLWECTSIIDAIIIKAGITWCTTDGIDQMFRGIKYALYEIPGVYWHDNILELVILSFIVSPNHCIKDDTGLELIQAILIAIHEVKTTYDLPYDLIIIINNITEDCLKCDSDLVEMVEIIKSRINFGPLSEVMIGVYSNLYGYVRGYNNNILSICRLLDKEKGLKPSYKNCSCIDCDLSVEERNAILLIKESRNLVQHDSVRINKAKNNLLFGKSS